MPPAPTKARLALGLGLMIGSGVLELNSVMWSFRFGDGCWEALGAGSATKITVSAESSK